MNINEACDLLSRVAEDYRERARQTVSGVVTPENAAALRTSSDIFMARKFLLEVRDNRKCDDADPEGAAELAAREADAEFAETLAGETCPFCGDEFSDDRCLSAALARIAALEAQVREREERVKVLTADLEIAESRKSQAFQDLRARAESLDVQLQEVQADYGELDAKMFAEVDRADKAESLACFCNPRDMCLGALRGKSVV